MQLDFKKSLSEAALYVKGDAINFVSVSLYVDDLLITRNNEELVRQFKEDVKQIFEMTNLGEMTYFLGMEINQKNEGMFICQTKYAKEILKKFKMDEYKSVDTPMCQKEKLSKEDETKKVDETFYKSLFDVSNSYKTKHPTFCKSIILDLQIMQLKHILELQKESLDMLKGH